MKKVLKEEELKAINNSKNSYEIKFKVVEEINKLKKIKKTLYLKIIQSFFIIKIFQLFL